MLNSIRIGVNKWLVVNVLVFLLLIALTGCQTSKKEPPPARFTKKTAPPARLTKKPEPPARLLVKSVTLTRDKVPMGGAEFTITNNRVNPDELFGPPDTEAWPKEGHIFLIISVNIETDSADKWVDLVRSTHLVGSKGSKHFLGLWYYKDAYRTSNALTFGRRSISPVPSTSLIYHLPDPLPADLKMIAGGKEVADISSLLP